MTASVIWIYLMVVAKGPYMNKSKKKNPSASPMISVVVPVYKEERGIRPFLSRLRICDKQDGNIL